MSGASMRARRWAIAACFCDPGDYDIPTVPTFATDRDGDETVLYGDDGRELMRAGTLTPRRR